MVYGILGLNLNIWMKLPFRGSDVACGLDKYIDSQMPGSVKIT